MKLAKLPLAIITVLSMTACSSDDDSAQPVEEQIRTVSISTNLKEISDIGTMDDGVPVKVTRDSKGYAHFLRTDGYTLSVKDSVDGYGIDYEIEIDITEPLEIDIVGAAEVQILPNQVSPASAGQAIESYKYYSVESAVETISRDDVQFNIEVENKSFSIVTTDINDNIEYINSTINSDRFGVVGEKCIESEQPNCPLTRPADGVPPVMTESGYLYAYYNTDSAVLFTATTGQAVSDEIDYQPKQHVNYTINLDGDTGEIIIKDPEFDPIEVGAPVITDKQLFGGKIIDTHPLSGVVTVELDGNRDPGAIHNPLWLYPDFDFSAFANKGVVLGELALNFDYEAEQSFLDKTSSGVYIKIHFGYWDDETTYTYYVGGQSDTSLNGKVVRDDSAESYESFEAFQLAHSEQKIFGIPDGNQLLTNFMVRVGDNTNSGGDLMGEKFIINQFTLTQTVAK